MYQSVGQQEEETYESVSAKPKRNKGPSRCYNVMMIVVYFALLLMTVVALGTFGAKQSQITNRARKELNSTTTTHTCILYSTFLWSDKDSDGKTIVHMKFHSSGLCGYVFWGLASLTIVAFVWFVYSIVQAIFAPRIISLLRILDLIVMASTCLLSFTVSVTIHAGLDQTCNVLKTHSDGNVVSCQGSYLVEDPAKNIKRLEFYDVMNTAKSSSWATTVSLIVLSVWYTIMAVSYCCMVRNRRKDYTLLRDDEYAPTAV